MEGFRAERKAGVPRNYQSPTPLPQGMFSAALEGGSVVVKDDEQAYNLYSAGTFGSYVGQRMNFVNDGCFPACASNEAATSDEQYAKEGWRRTVSRCGSLFLSPEEVIFLTWDVPVLQVTNETALSLWQRFCADRGGVVFVRKYAVYAHFRRRNWVVRSGVFFGADYLLYKDGPEFNHSSAAVRIASRLEEPFLAGMQRELGNCKKTLVVATVRIPDDLDCSVPSCMSEIEVLTTTPTHWDCNKERMADLNLSVK